MQEQVEKSINLENIALPEFLGVQNQNINAIATEFPTCKIVSRGSVIGLKGKPSEIIKINEVILKLMDYFHKYGEISPETVKYIIDENELAPNKPSSDEILIYGTKGNLIKAKTINQQKLVSLSKKNDLVFCPRSSRYWQNLHFGSFGCEGIEE